jgi:hypothetical protein
MRKTTSAGIVYLSPVVTGCWSRWQPIGNRALRIIVVNAS